MVIRKISFIGNSSFVSIPSAFLRTVGLKPGDYVSVALLQNDLLVIAPIEKQALLAQVGLLKLTSKNENPSWSLR